MSKPLSGIVVLDLSRVLAGPWCTQILADLGAEVIKIERPGKGDDTRSWGPPFIGDPAEGKSAYYLSANRGKKSVCIDLKNPQGQRLIKQIAAKSDLVVENYKTGGLKKYGLDYESLSALNPRLIYCSITGFGQTGPDADQAGYDFLIQAMSGLMSITGSPDRPPMKTGVAVSDLFTGLYAVIGILAALREREVSGIGQHIDMALLDCQMAVLSNQAMNYLVGGTAPQRIGNAHPNIVPYEAFAAKDGHIIIAVGNDSQYQRFCTVIDRPDLKDHPDYQSNAGRVAHREALCHEIAQRMKTRTVRDWMALLDAEKIPCGPINDIGDAFAEPQAKARQIRREITDSAGDQTPSVANPIHFSRSKVTYDIAPPLLGEHTETLLRHMLGLDDQEVAALKKSGAIA